MNPFLWYGLINQTTSSSPVYSMQINGTHNVHSLSVLPAVCCLWILSLIPHLVLAQVINYLQNSFPPKWLHNIFLPWKANMVSEPAQNHFQRCQHYCAVYYCVLSIISNISCYNVEYKRNITLFTSYCITYLKPQLRGLFFIKNILVLEGDGGIFMQTQNATF